MFPYLRYVVMYVGALDHPLIHGQIWSLSFSPTTLSLVLHFTFLFAGVVFCFFFDDDSLCCRMLTLQSHLHIFALAMTSGVDILADRP